MDPSEHSFGGPWTDEKLERVFQYLKAYSTALKNQPFRRLYIDAFAGTGYRAQKKTGEKIRGFPALPQMTELAKGSARRALEVVPSFDQYVFIEANPGRFCELRKLETEFPQHRRAMIFRNEDANNAITDLCQTTNWQNSRAVLFLDPYGMQVNWSTVVEIANTQHIDLWYLFPVGAVQRLLTRDGVIGPEWRAALNRFWGDQSWGDEFYKNEKQRTLFGEINQKTKIADLFTIEEFVRRRLSQIFKGGVSNTALQLKNKKGSCMFLLFFACGNPNPKAYRLALKFAQHILRP